MVIRIPQIRLPVLNDDRTFILPWVRFFQQLAGVVEPTTFGLLPSNPTDGETAFITDSSLVAAGNFGMIVTGGGTNHVPLYWDGGTNNWRIG